MRLLPVFILFVFFSCHSGPELNGHWHLVHDRDYEIESTIDFLDDSTFLYQSHPPYYGGWGGYIDRQAQTMYWGGECMMGNWRYELSQDNHWNVYSLKDENGLVGTLIPHPECSGIDDLFLDSKMDIQLPVLAGSTPDIGEASLTSYLYVGPVKPKYQEVYPAEWSISLGDKIVKPDDQFDLTLFDEQHRVKLPERKRGCTKKLVFLDRNAPVSALEPLVRHYCQAGRDELYFAGVSGRGKDAHLVYEARSLTVLEKELAAKFQD